MGRGRRRAGRALVAVLMAVCGLLMFASAGQAADCSPYWMGVATPPPGHWQVVHARDDSDVWVAGGPKAAHWDGTAWTTYDLPFGDPVYDDAVWAAIDSAGPSDVWLGGTVEVEGVWEVAQLLHWDGSSWTAVGAAGSNVYDLDAITPDDVWVVGSDGQGRVSDPEDPVVSHWDGTDWAEAGPPWTRPDDETQGSNFGVYTVAAAATDDVWIRRGDGVLHFDGSSWTPLTFSGDRIFALDIAALSPNDVWFAGQRLLHFNGAGLQEVAAPFAPKRLGAVSSGDVWGTDGSKLIRWDGRSWKAFAVPGAVDPWRLSALPDGRVWGVAPGSGGGGGPLSRICETSVSDAGIAPATVTVPQGSPASWHFDTANLSSHRVADGTGLALFDSGLRPAGGAYAYTFGAAGRYTITDSVNGASQNVSVLLKVRPSYVGNTHATFTVRWASGVIKPGTVFDAQIKRPGSAFVDWITATTTSAGPFVSDAGPGEYAFRARMRNPTTGAASNWSIPRPITVTP